jgi:hypothetical protein
MASPSLPPPAPIIADYAKQGWVFAAAKLSRPDATDKTSPHPLAFMFKADRAVYPLRLTGVENHRCLVELYVFGESRAELPGFTVEQCFGTQFPSQQAGLPSASQHPANCVSIIPSCARSSQARLSAPSWSARSTP